MEPVIQTYSGKKFDPLNPRAEDICIEDIAHALSLKCRFGGHCTSFYSVAQHSVLASSIAEAQQGSTEMQLWALLHDAAEAYLPDVATPIKHFLQFEKKLGEWFVSVSFKYVEEMILEKIAQVFCFPSPPMPELIKEIDLRMVATERQQLMSEGFVWGGLLGVDSYKIPIISWSPAEAEISFLMRFRSLQASREY